MGKTKKIGSSAMWDKDTKIIFCDICLKEVELGNRRTTYFNKESWQNIIKKLKESIGTEYDRMQLKNKWYGLKKDWKIWNELKRGSTGLGWDPIKRTIDASEEWWAKRLKVVPTAKKFKLNGIEPELEEKLDRLFGGVMKTDNHALTPSEPAFVNIAEPLNDEQTTDSSEGPCSNLNEVESTGRSKPPKVEETSIQQVL